MVSRLHMQNKPESIPQKDKEETRKRKEKTKRELPEKGEGAVG